MKKLILILMLAAGPALGQGGFRNSASQVLPHASTLASNDVFNIGTTGSPISPTNKNVRAGILAQYLAAENDRRTYNVKTWGADSTGSTESSERFQTVANQAQSTGGTILIPDGTFLLTNGVLIGGSTMSTPWSTSGNIQIRGTRKSRIDFRGLTNAVELINGTRFMTVSDLHIVGTNTTRDPSIKQVGILFHGPSGVTRIEDVNVQQCKFGIYLHDATGVYLDNILCASNFVGLAFGYQPDGDTVRGRFHMNDYGVMTRATNSQATIYANQFSTISGTGKPIISGVFGYNRVGILIPGSAAIIEHAYFEGNSTSVQIGYDTANAYENSYSSGSTTPLVHFRDNDYNSAQDVRVYRASTITAQNVRWGGTRIELMNSDADDSTIDSDVAVTVVKSDASTLTVNEDWRYEAGVLVPRSGMSWTNLVDMPAGFSDGTDDGGESEFWKTNHVAGGYMTTNFADHYWSMNETTGTRFDSIGVAHLAAVGSPGAGSARLNGGVTNFSSSNYLQGDDDADLSYRGSGGFTVGGWFQAYTPAGQDTTMIGKGGEWRIYYDGATANRTRIEFGNANLLLAESWTSTAPNGNTTNKFVTMTWDGSTLSGQINAGTVYTTNLSTSGGAITVPSDTTGVLTVAFAGDANGFTAADEVFLAHRTIGDTERAAIKNGETGRALAPNGGQVTDLNVLRNLQVKWLTVPTNANPTNVSWTNQAPHRWFKLFDDTGAAWFTPAWTNL